MMAKMSIGQRRAINPPGDSKEFLNELLFTMADEKAEKLLVEYPKLKRFDDVGLPMHLALHKLEISCEQSKQADVGEHIVMISKVQPGFTSVVTETHDGRRTANLYQFPIDTLAMMMPNTPEHLMLYVAQTLQMRLNIPSTLRKKAIGF